MWKLLIYVYDYNLKALGRCYMFEFKTEKAVLEASSHFSRGDCYCSIVKDD